MKNDVIKGRSLVVISTALILTICAITYGMYFVTGYYLYYFLFISCLFLGATNLLFILLKWEDTRNKNPKVKIKKKKHKMSRRRRREKEGEEVTDDFPPEEENPKKSPKKKGFLNRHRLTNVLCYAGYIFVFYWCCQSIVSHMQNLKIGGNVLVVNAVFLLILFVVVIILDRLCKYSEDNTPFVEALLGNTRIFFKLISLQSLLATACVIFESLKIYNIQKYVAYLYVIMFFYYVVFITISLMVVAIRKDFCVAPVLNVPIPMPKFLRRGKETEENKRESFIDYLEKNTGISMRSLWSVKYVKQIFPMVVFAAGVCLWLSTSIVQIESYQQAAVYRLGTLQEDVLGPGIHFVLPYPFDSVEIYDTQKVNKTTIGYKAEESTDNIWTAGHQGEEYKLLLGGGDELVSINLRLEYKINDLEKYLRTATSPESIMQALAYELVTDQTIATDLTTLLSTDRDAFANNFKQELADKMKEQDIGLEVVSVVLESIHPPVDIASVYQELISAGITAEKYILYAQASAAVTIAEAETSYDTAVGVANAQYAEKVAAAKSSIAEFMASVEAYNSNPDAYTYQKYLAAVRQAYGNAKLVILSEDIDQSAIIFGDLVGGTTGNSGTTENSGTTGN